MNCQCDPTDLRIQSYTGLVKSGWRIETTPQFSPLFYRCLLPDRGHRFQRELEFTSFTAQIRDAGAFADQVDDDPAAIALLDVLERKRRRLLASQSAAEHNRQQSAIPLAFGRVPARTVSVCDTCRESASTPEIRRIDQRIGDYVYLRTAKGEAK